MTKEKWIKLYENCLIAHSFNWTEAVQSTGILPSPENWNCHREILLTFIKNADELTEIYNIENKGKENV